MYTQLHISFIVPDVFMCFGNSRNKMEFEKNKEWLQHIQKPLEAQVLNLYNPTMNYNFLL